MNILIIDDCTDIAEMYAMVYMDLGHSVTVIENPDRLQFLSDIQSYDLAIVDYLLPGMMFKNGLEVVGWLQQFNINCYLITAVPYMVKAGNIEILQKPISIRHLERLANVPSGANS